MITSSVVLRDIPAMPCIDVHPIWRGVGRVSPTTTINCSVKGELTLVDQEPLNKLTGCTTSNTAVPDIAVLLVQLYANRANVSEAGWGREGGEGEGESEWRGAR